MRLAVALALTLALTAPASADGPTPIVPLPQEAPAGHRYADRMLRDALAIADMYWLTQGVQPRCPAELWLFTEPQDDASRAETPGCRVWFERGYRDRVWQTVHERMAKVTTRRREAYRLCGLAVHERGHNAGLGHATSVLSVMFEPWSRAVPGVCWAWAVRIVPKRKVGR